MSRQVVDFGTLTIASGQTTSGTLASVIGSGALVDLTIYGPAALTGTVTVQVAPNNNPVSGDWKALQSAGADVTVPAAKATTIAASFRALRLVSESSEGADRAFRVIGQIATGD